MKIQRTNRNGSSTVNVVILLLVALAMVVGAYFYLNGSKPFRYESEGNVIRFPNKPLARECAGIEDLKFEMDGFDFTFNGQYTGTGGLIEFDVAFKLLIEGSISGPKPVLPFTEAELKTRVEEEVDKKLAELAKTADYGKEGEELQARSKVIEISLPAVQPAAESDKKAGENEDAGAKGNDDQTSEGNESEKDDSAAEDESENEGSTDDKEDSSEKESDK